MYRRYMAKKAQLDKQNSGICNEKGLWHCASRDALLKINRHGFHRSYCSKNGKNYFTDHTGWCLINSILCSAGCCQNKNIICLMNSKSTIFLRERFSIKMSFTSCVLQLSQHPGSSRTMQFLI